MTANKFIITETDGTQLSHITFHPYKDGYAVTDGGNFYEKSFYKGKYTDFKDDVRMEAKEYFQLDIVGVEFLREEKPRNFLEKIFGDFSKSQITFTKKTESIRI